PMPAADRYRPPPPALADSVFNFSPWTHQPTTRSAECGVRNGEENSPPRTPHSALSDGFLFLTHADTDLLALHHALPLLPAGFPPVRALRLGNLTTEEHMAAALAGPVPPVLVARVLGGINSVPGFRRLAEAARGPGRHLVVVSGTGHPDPDLTASSTVAPAAVHEVTAYLQAGG